MVDAATLASVTGYLSKLADTGVPASFGVLFGSRVSGTADDQSDIDLIVVSPVFDGPFSRDLVNQLWRTAARVDSRIEPIPCGQNQWESDQITPILEMARQNGLRVLPGG
ncbi:MAG: nucleotidyltransferase domain-containing protein [Candidatus Sumerlaeaceae bacterium]|nr:nucleotidyltransferase domain-containing protein [Candidatus Sumerlaeaceae bacterium]